VPIAFAIRCASCSPRPGQNHGRTVTPSTVSGAVSTLPLCWTSRRVHSCSKSAVYRAASSAESRTTMTFSSRANASSV